jgi:hypothetical protein
MTRTITNDIVTEAEDGCRFRKPYPIDSRSAANQNMIAA